MSIIYLLRHGESTSNANKEVHYSMKDEAIPLTEKGCNQAVNAARLMQQDVEKNHIPTDLQRTGIFASPYLRTTNTAEIISKEIQHRAPCRINVLLSEQNFGEGKGSNIRHLEKIPIEQTLQDALGKYHYRFNRGESLLDMQVRCGVFLSQQNYFEYMPMVILVSHQSTCLMMHSFMTEELPEAPTETNWPNCDIRKYSINQRQFKYLGKLT